MEKFSEKLKNQIHLNLLTLVADVDGTIFTAGWEIIKAPFYNMQSSEILKKNSVPLILVTGRPYWNIFSDYEMRLHGFPSPDIAIIAAGTIILKREKNGTLKKDIVWEKMMSETKITKKEFNRTISEKWGSKEIFGFVRKYLQEKKIQARIKSENNFIVRITVINFPNKKLKTIITDFEKYWIEGVKIVTTEKLLRKNSLEIFSGDIIIIPKIAGKEEAIKYLLEKFSQEESTRIHALIFGDASIDIGMLMMKENKFFSFSQYGVHLSPLAKKELSENQKKNKNLQIINSEGPQAILNVLKNQSFGKEKFSVYFSLSQNSRARLFLKPVESLLDRIFDKKLSPNDISFLGLKKVIEGINLINKPGLFLKTKGFFIYASGIVTDLFDGIRARQTNTFAQNGQLVDVFCDRAKEFYQLSELAHRQFFYDGNKFYQTLITAISCILPSISRAQAELSGCIVDELDKKRGSAFDRSQRLFFSLFFHMLNLRKNPFNLNEKIFRANMATYYNRLSYIRNPESSIAELSGDIKYLNALQQRALERLLLLLELLQEENILVKRQLEKYPDYLNKYKSDFEKNIIQYLTLNINKLRSQHNISDYHLTLKSYLP